ncbi:MAG TPA: VOC family protein, partial [Acidimicrobiales bacterium]|nr:VOC family protein [Acidimicrobiales bacterium]
MAEPVIDPESIEATRRRIRETCLRAPGERRSVARGLHHVALLSSDVERTVHFYQDVVGFPLTDIF